MLDRDRKVPQALLPPATCVFPLLQSSCDEAGALAEAGEGGRAEWLELPVKGPSTKGGKGGSGGSKREKQALVALDGSVAAGRDGDGTIESLDYARFHGSQRTSLFADDAASAPRPPAQIERVEGVTAEKFGVVRARGEPVVLCGVDWGPCVGAWTPQYLARHGNTTVEGEEGNVAGVHVCSETTVDLAGHRLPGIPKNFSFHEMPFQELIRRCSPASFQGESLPPVVCEGER